MAYTLTQARPLLTTAELELFSQSRTEPVKSMAPADLASAVKRTRTLRDKYRDLYQRQTLAVRTGSPSNVTGEDNERTQRKADILQEVLDRYEARATLLQERASSATASKGKASAKAPAPHAADSQADADAAAPAADKAGSAPERSSKAPSPKAPTAQGKASAPDLKAPLDMVPAADRASPLKKDPGNIAIHAHQSASGRRTQGKRDSR